MTITTNPARNEYTANAGQTVFNYTFKIFADTDLNVYITPEGQDCDDSTDLTTAYTVSGVGDEDGGSITLTTPTSLNDLVTIVSDIPSSRTTDYQNNGDFRPDVVNDDFDRVVSIAKKVEDLTNRTVLLPQCQQGPKPLSLPAPGNQGEILIWNANGSGLENATIEDAGTAINNIRLDNLGDYTDFVFDVISDIDSLSNSHLKVGDLISVANYSLTALSGTLFGKIVTSGTGTDDGGKYIDLPTLGLQFEQNLPLLPTVKHWGAVGDGATEDQISIRSAINYVGSKGGGALLFPPAPDGYLVTAPSDTQVATDEGAVFQLEAAQSNIRFLGYGKNVSVIKPKTNKLEIFGINGATNTEFFGLGFDNSANGPLKNQVKSTGLAINTGIAGNGNAANAAIQQYEGAGLHVEDCGFIGLDTCIRYFGSAADESQLFGTLKAINLEFDDFSFGVVCRQPEKLICDNLIGKDCSDSVNADLSRNPGHEIYVTNRPGARPKTINISNINSENGENTAVKVRKGEQVAVNNVTIQGGKRGVEFWNIERLTFSDITVSLVDNSAEDTNQNALELTDMGYTEGRGCVLDVRGAQAWGLRMRADQDSETWHNVGVNLSDITVINDYSGGTDRALFLALDQEDLKLTNCKGVHDGSTDPTKSYFDIRNCTEAKVIKPKADRRGAATWDRLLSFDATCTDCVVDWSENDLNFTPSTTTIDDSGTDSVLIFNDGELINWTPQFGGVTATYNDQLGVATKVGDIVHAQIYINTNTLDTADTSPMQVTLPIATTQHEMCVATIDTDNSSVFVTPSDILGAKIDSSGRLGFTKSLSAFTYDDGTLSGGVLRCSISYRATTPDIR